jgi:hypothetical protein
MPENPVYSRDDGHFIYLATVELGNKEGVDAIIAINGREGRLCGKCPCLPM